MAERKNKSYKTEFKEPTPIRKIASQTKADRLNKLNQLRQNKLDTTILQKRGIIDKDGESTIQSINATNLTALIDYTEYVKAPALCVLIALNEEADLKKLALDIYNLFDKDKASIRAGENLFTGLVPLDIVKGKERITVVGSDRSIISSLDYCKAADLIVFVSSCKAKHDVSLIKKDPYSAVNVIDELGYETISAIKAQGMLPHVSVIQDLDEVEEKHRQPMKKLYTRYLESELKPIKTLTLNQSNTDEVKALLRTIYSANIFQETMNLRKHRSYMLCDNFYPEPSKTNPKENNLVVHGYVKGNTFNNLNYCHLTGFGDFIALSVEDEIEDPVPVHHSKKAKKESKTDVNMDTDPVTSNLNTTNNNPDANPEANVFNTANTEGKPVIIDDEFKKNKQSRLEQNKINIDLDKGIDDLIDFNLDPKEEDISFHDEEEEKLIKEQEVVHQGYSRKHEAKTSLFYRKPEDMEVPDEVDTPINTPCRELFSKYRGLSSMNTGSLDPTVNLPKEYSNIFSFENIRHTFKESAKSAHEHGLRVSGKYVKITLKNFKDFHLLSKNKPLVLSSLMNHERKLCVMHLKINLREDYEEPIYSKQLIEAQIGFRRVLTRPIYTHPIGETDKLKKERKLEKGKFLIATVYAQLAFPETPVIMLRPDLNGTQMKQVAVGKTLQSDCNKILIKRIVLTGYPLKIHKRSSVVRYMFFNPEDVNYYKPIPLFTKLGLRGNITESLGTHGYMKCTFNDSLKGNDTVCMALFKRIFPVWFPESWRLALGYSDDKKYYEVFRSDTSEFAKKEEERYKVADENDQKENLNSDLNEKKNVMMVDA